MRGNFAYVGWNVKANKKKSSESIELGIYTDRTVNNDKKIML